MFGRAVSLAALVAFLALCASGIAEVPVYEATEHMTLLKTVPNGELYKLSTPGTGVESVNFHVAHIYGTQFERGQAYGRLLKDEINKFFTETLPTAFIMADAAKDMANEFLPEVLNARLRSATGVEIWDAIVETLQWVADTQLIFYSQLPNKPMEMFDGIADGMCEDHTCRAEMRLRLRNLNMIPELVRMGCSIVGTWGKANPASAPGLLQLRALDFGAGPWPNNHVLVVEHPSEGNAFASLSFYGMIGIVTAISDKIALTEKLFASEKGGIRDGTYHGSTIVLVLRQVMELSQSPAEAVEVFETTNRTWSVFLGVGARNSPAASNVDPMTVVTYTHDAVTSYTPFTFPQVTGGTPIKDAFYVDRHPQPSVDRPMEAMMLEQVHLHGGVTARFLMQNIPSATNTGDVHMQFYDANTRSVYYSIGYTENFQYPEGGKAMFRPWVRFAADALLQKSLGQGRSSGAGVGASRASSSGNGKGEGHGKQMPCA